MAIAGITLHTIPDAFEVVRERLTALPEIVNEQTTDTPFFLAAVLEASTERIETLLSRMAEWEGVLNAALVYVNYEDELDEHGFIPCPSHRPRRHGASVTDPAMTLAAPLTGADPAGANPTGCDPAGCDPADFPA